MLGCPNRSLASMRGCVWRKEAPIVNYKSTVLLWLSILLAACGGQPIPATPAGFSTPIPNRVEAHTDSGTDGHAHIHLDPSQATAAMQVVLVPSELVVGQNRFAVGLLDAAGHLILNAEVHFHYFDLTSPNAPVLESEADAVRLQTPDGSTTIFAQERNFDRAGTWGIEVLARFPDGTAAIKRIQFQVLADSSTVTPGQKAPAIHTSTAADVNGDLSRLTSAAKPNPTFYKVSLAKAIASGKPTVLLFSTPAFCQSRLCGPAYDSVSDVQKIEDDAVNFVHVEVYTGLPNPADNNWQVAPAMTAFGLTSEPWVFLIDGSGTVVYRVEGLVTADEIERHVQVLLSK